MLSVPSYIIADPPDMPLEEGRAEISAGDPNYDPPALIHGDGFDLDGDGYPDIPQEHCSGGDLDENSVVSVDTQPKELATNVEEPEDSHYPFREDLPGWVADLPEEIKETDRDVDHAPPKLLDKPSKSDTTLESTPPPEGYYEDPMDIHDMWDVDRDGVPDEHHGLHPIDDEQKILMDKAAAALDDINKSGYFNFDIMLQPEHLRVVEMSDVFKNTMASTFLPSRSMRPNIFFNKDTFRDITPAQAAEITAHEVGHIYWGQTLGHSFGHSETLAYLTEYSFRKYMDSKGQPVERDGVLRSDDELIARIVREAISEIPPRIKIILKRFMAEDRGKDESSITTLKYDGAGRAVKELEIVTEESDDGYLRTVESIIRELEYEDNYWPYVVKGKEDTTTEMLYGNGSSATEWQKNTYTNDGNYTVKSHEGRLLRHELNASGNLTKSVTTYKDFDLTVAYDGDGKVKNVEIDSFEIEKPLVYHRNSGGNYIKTPEIDEDVWYKRLDEAHEQLEKHYEKHPTNEHVRVEK